MGGCGGGWSCSISSEVGQARWQTQVRGALSAAGPHRFSARRKFSLSMHSAERPHTRRQRRQTPHALRAIREQLPDLAGELASQGGNRFFEDSS
jgi:hypothetical protein